MMRAGLSGALLASATLILGWLLFDRRPRMRDAAGILLPRRTLHEACPWLLHDTGLHCSSCGQERAAEDLYLYADTPYWLRFVCIGCDRSLQGAKRENLV